MATYLDHNILSDPRTINFIDPRNDTHPVITDVNCSVIYPKFADENIFRVGLGLAEIITVYNVCTELNVRNILLVSHALLDLMLD